MVSEGLIKSRLRTTTSQMTGILSLIYHNQIIKTLLRPPQLLMHTLTRHSEIWVAVSSSPRETSAKSSPRNICSPASTFLCEEKRHRPSFDLAMGMHTGAVCPSCGPRKSWDGRHKRNMGQVAVTRAMLKAIYALLTTPHPITRRPLYPLTAFS